MGEHSYHLMTGMLRPLDLITILIFFALMAWIGIYAAKKNKSTEAYFVGNRSFPGWAIGLSMLGTSISSITFLALPAAAYSLDYRNIVPNMMLPIIAVVAIILFIPIFRRGKIISVFEYLENRFGHISRFYASISFLFLQVLRICTVLFLVAIPMSLITGQSIILVILITGFIVGLYTIFGGIEAVIWTDVVQTIILLGGGILCLILVLINIPGGLDSVITIGISHNKFSIGKISFSLTSKTFLMMMILGLINFCTEYISNQTVIQRYVAAKSTREARKATIICAASSIPTWLLFFFVGTCLFAYYIKIPPPATLNADQIMPYFILTKIPSGIAGLILAGCLAAAMSTLSSSISAMSSVATVDIFERYIFKQKQDKFYLTIGRLCSLVAVILMILGAIVIKYIPRENMVDLGFMLSGMFGGCILGIYLLGIFTTRVGNASLLVGMFSAIIMNIYLMLDAFNIFPSFLSLHLNSYYIVILVNITILLVALLLSIFLPCKKKDLSGLTVWTMKKKGF
ncbi:MAG: sodium/solute symporter [bacterium]|nr:sodium/solute symporter [bacterium]